MLHLKCGLIEKTSSSSNVVLLVDHLVRPFLSNLMQTLHAFVSLIMLVSSEYFLGSETSVITVVYSKSTLNI